MTDKPTPAPAPELEPDPPTLSAPIIEFLQGLVNAQTIRVGDPNFDQAVAVCSRAKAELAALAG
jgi:hypothetical protein